MSLLNKMIGLKCGEINTSKIIGEEIDKVVPKIITILSDTKGVEYIETEKYLTELYAKIIANRITHVDSDYYFDMIDSHTYIRDSLSNTITFYKS